MTTNPTDFYDIYSLLNKAERETLTRWRIFLGAEVAPIANDTWERGEFPASVSYHQDTGCAARGVRAEEPDQPRRAPHPCKQTR